MLKMQIIGHLGQDCTIKDISGKKVINFSVAHSEKRKKPDGSFQEWTTWVNCSWWTDSTSIAGYLKAGQQVYVEGGPSSQGYAKDGKCFSSLNMNVRALTLLGKKKDGNEGVNQNDYHDGSHNDGTEDGGAPVVKDPADDLPF